MPKMEFSLQDIVTSDRMHSSCLDTEEYARYENPSQIGRGSLFSRQESQMREPLLAGNL